MSASAAEVARLFSASVTAGSNAPGEVYPGRPGLVMAAGEVRSMAWGFPLKLKGASKPKPVNNARTDKLDSFMWRYSFAERRCLIPVSAFAEAEGAACNREFERLFPGGSRYLLANILKDAWIEERHLRGEWYDLQAQAWFRADGTRVWD